MADKETKIEVEETQSEFDTDTALADISSELFRQGNDEEISDDKTTEGEGDELSGKPSADVADASPQPVIAPEPTEIPAADENATEVQEVGAPKTWTKEALATWATIPERAQQEILKREDDFLKGITQYKTAADIGMSYSKVVEPYAPILAAENIDPVQMFQSFAANHYLLTRGTPQQKIELAANMLSGYQIPLADLLNYIADTDVDLNPVDPRVQSLEKELAEVKNLVSTANKRQTDAATDAISREIDAFAADPAHPYFDELAGDIQKLFGSGLASSLQEAYDKAVFANPETRQKEIDRLTAEKLSAANDKAEIRKDKITKSTAADVILTPKSRDGTIPKGSIDDTLEETMAAIQSRG